MLYHVVGGHQDWLDMVHVNRGQKRQSGHKNDASFPCQNNNLTNGTFFLRAHPCIPPRSVNLEGVQMFLVWGPFAQIQILRIITL